jgi:excinuclease UvrABC ATPase subunit
MIKLKWKDITSYSRSDADRTPRSYEAIAGAVRVVVTRRIDLRPTDWLIEFGGGGATVGGNVSAKVAQQEAEDRLRSYARRILESLGAR